MDSASYPNKSVERRPGAAIELGYVPAFSSSSDPVRYDRDGNGPDPASKPPTAARRTKER